MIVFGGVLLLLVGLYYMFSFDKRLGIYNSRVSHPINIFASILFTVGFIFVIVGAVLESPEFTETDFSNQIQEFELSQLDTKTQLSGNFLRISQEEVYQFMDLDQKSDVYYTNSAKPGTGNPATLEGAHRFGAEGDPYAVKYGCKKTADWIEMITVFTRPDDVCLIVFNLNNEDQIQKIDLDLGN
jgi:hypothetical protein